MNISESEMYEFYVRCICLPEKYEDRYVSKTRVMYELDKDVFYQVAYLLINFDLKPIDDFAILEESHDSFTILYNSDKVDTILRMTLYM